MKSPERVSISASFNNFGCVILASIEPLSAEHFDILLRFAKVFDLSYTRFNDLKQAEAQAREVRRVKKYESGMVCTLRRRCSNWKNWTWVYFG